MTLAFTSGVAGYFSDYRAQTAKFVRINAGDASGISSGSDDTSTAAAFLTDSAAAFVATDGVAVGDIVYNITDGSWAEITAVDATTITGTLAGGTNNNWDSGDTYRVDGGGNSLRLDMSGIITEYSALQDRNGEDIVKLKLESEYDPTGVKDMEVIVVNTVSTLA